MSTVHAERILRNKMEQIIDAIELGSDHDMFEGLNEEEAQALRAITDFGHPLKAWFAYKELGDGALPVPSPDYLAWDMYRDSDKNPLYPQRPMLLGPIFSGNGPGCKQNGDIQGKVIVVAGLMDEVAYPWQADWYRRKVASVHKELEEELIRL